MRLKSEIWVKAYLRRVAGEGAFCVVVRRGHDEAGAIFIKQTRLDGNALVFSPAPAGFDTGAEDRQWVATFGEEPVAEEKVDEYLTQQAKYDADIWVIEVEDREGRHFMEDWLSSS